MGKMNISTISVHGFDAMLKSLRLPFSLPLRSKVISCTTEAYKPLEGASDWLIDSTAEHIEVDDRDMTRLKNLINTGNADAKCMRMVHVSAYITADRGWWQEADTYHFNTKVSESTMHTIGKGQLSLENFNTDGLDAVDLGVLMTTIERINALAREYSETHDYSLVRRIKKLLPESFLQSRVLDTNYQELRTMYLQRWDHRLPEWSDVFMRWIDTLPLAGELIKTPGDGR